MPSAVLRQWSVIVAALLLVAATGADAARPVTSPPDAEREHLIEVTREDRAALERVLAFKARDLESAGTLAAQRRELFSQGLISRRDLEAATRSLEEARTKWEDARLEIDQADQALAEALAAPALDGNARTIEPPVVPYLGTARWSLTDATRLDQFFRERFGRPLPVSVYGQSLAHTRLGFDHTQALDAALHPDSVEGLALIEFLRRAGIPFIAFRGPIAGQATGAHIHVGSPSPRTARPRSG